MSFNVIDLGTLKTLITSASYISKIHRVSETKTVNFLSQLCQIFTNFNNSWHVDGYDDEIM